MPGRTFRSSLRSLRQVTRSSSSNNPVGSASSLWARRSASPTLTRVAADGWWRDTASGEWPPRGPRPVATRGSRGSGCGPPIPTARRPSRSSRSSASTARVMGSRPPLTSRPPDRSSPPTPATCRSREASTRTSATTAPSPGTANRPSIGPPRKGRSSTRCSHSSRRGCAQIRPSSILRSSEARADTA